MTDDPEAIVERSFKLLAEHSRKKGSNAPSIRMVKLVEVNSRVRESAGVYAQALGAFWVRGAFSGWRLVRRFGALSLAEDSRALGGVDRYNGCPLASKDSLRTDNRFATGLVYSERERLARDERAFADGRALLTYRGCSARAHFSTDVNALPPCKSSGDSPLTDRPLSRFAQLAQRLGAVGGIVPFLVLFRHPCPRFPYASFRTSWAENDAPLTMLDAPVLALVVAPVRFCVRKAHFAFLRSVACAPANAASLGRLGASFAPSHALFRRVASALGFRQCGAHPCRRLLSDHSRASGGGRAKIWVTTYPCRRFALPKFKTKVAKWSASSQRVGGHPAANEKGHLAVTSFRVRFTPVQMVVHSLFDSPAPFVFAASQPANEKATIAVAS